MKLQNISILLFFSLLRITKRIKKFVLILLLFQSMTSMGQFFVYRYANNEDEKFPGVKTLTVDEERYGFKKNWICREIYYFDEKGNTIRSSFFVGKKLHSSYEFIYNDRGLVIKENQTYHIQKKNKLTSESFFYEFDTNDRVIKMATDTTFYTSTLFYQDFDKNNNPQTIITKFEDFKRERNHVSIRKIEYNSFNKPVLIQILKKDSITDIEEMRYNEFGDIIYSNVPTLLNKETGKMEPQIGGSRYAVVEEYEYVYDESNRWIEKYVVYDGKRKLLLKRFFELEKQKKSQYQKTKIIF